MFQHVPSMIVACWMGIKIKAKSLVVLVIICLYNPCGWCKLHYYLFLGAQVGSEAKVNYSTPVCKLFFFQAFHSNLINSDLLANDRVEIHYTTYFYGLFLVMKSFWSRPVASPWGGQADLTSLKGRGSSWNFYWICITNVQEKANPWT